MSEGPYDFDLVCVGSGPAGQRAAVQAAKLGRRVLVVERRRVVGGVCIDTGTIPSKTFREAVLAVAGRAHGQNHGRNGGFGDSRPRPTAADLFARVNYVIDSEARIVEDQLARNGIELAHGEASFTGPHDIVITLDHTRRQVSAAHVLLACGTRPAEPADVGDARDLVMTSDEVINMQALPRTMAVIGGGVIGVEYASMFARMGVEVTLVDRRDRLLEFLDGEVVDELVHQMRNDNVTFRLGESVKRIAATTGAVRRAAVHLESGKQIVADLVLYSIGRVGATAALNLPAAGLSADDRGRLAVNQRFETTVPHVLAAGDVIGFPSLAATSSEQGRLAARMAFHVDAEPMAAHFPIGIYAIPEISMVGQPEHVLTEQHVPYEVGLARYREIARGQILGDDSGLFKMLFHRETRALLGVHAIGTGATELIHIGQAVMALGGGLDYFLNTVFNYPTLAECYKVAALDVANKLVA